VPEWTNGTVSKTVRGASLSGVQIPPLPPFKKGSLMPHHVKCVYSGKVVESAGNPDLDDVAVRTLG